MLIACRCLIAAGGVVTIVLIAARFGARSETDAYFIGRLIPVGLWMAFGRAFNLSFIPVYTRTLNNDGKEAAAELAGDFLNFTLWVSVLLTLICVLCADWMIALLAPGFSPDAHELAVTLTRIMACVIVLASLYAVFDSVMNAGHRYLLPALGSLWLPVGTLVGVLVLSERWGISGVAVGVLGGSAMQLATVVPGACRQFRLKFGLVNVYNRRLWETIRRLGPNLLIVGTIKINGAIHRVFASLVGPGAVSAFSFGFLFVRTTPALVTLPVYKVLYPEMVRLTTEDNRPKLRRLFAWNFFVIAFLTFPITAACVAFSAPLTGLVFQYGRFDQAAAAQTADVVFYLSLSFCPMVGSILLTYYFFATGRSYIVLRVVLMTFLLVVVLDSVLMHLMGLAGIALSGSLVSLIRLVVLSTVLSRAIGGLRVDLLVRPVAKLAAAAAVAGTATYYLAQWLGTVVPPRGLVEELLAVGGLAALGLVLYLGLNWLQGNQQAFILITKVGRALRRRKKAPPNQPA